MIGSTLGVLYGLAFIGGLFLCCVWGRVFNTARKVEADSQLSGISLGLSVGSLAHVGIFGFRTYQNLYYGPDPRIVDDAGIWVLIFCLLLVVFSKLVLMKAYDHGHMAKSWGWFVGVSIAWLVGAPFWLLSWGTP